MAPEILPRSRHSISRKFIDMDALKVLYRLSRAGHTAYLVGGGVRDLLLSRPPKDYDVSTSARPNDVKKLFRNCRLIGRRFRLAHILYGGGKVIEVSTFRRQADGDGEDLLVRRDNTYGTPEEDASRRDFTINGLFYDIATFSVIDHVGGLRDLENGTIRTIGDPKIRFREDPIRMLRAIKFAARLGFQIADDDLDAMREHRGDLLRAAAERVNLEIVRLLGEGRAYTCARLLESTGLLNVVAPEVTAYLSRNCSNGTGEGTDEDPFWMDLKGLDQLSAVFRERGKDLPQSVLLGALFRSVHERAPFRPASWRQSLPFKRGPTVSYGFGLAVGPRVSEAEQDHVREPAPQPASAELVDHLLTSALKRLAVPRREAESLLQSLALQQRLARPPQRPGAARALMHRQSSLAEALLLWEIRVRGGGRGADELRTWRSLLPELEDIDLTRPPRYGRRRPHNAPRKQDERSRATAPPDDRPARRRRRRRGGRGRSRSDPSP